MVIPAVVSDACLSVRAGLSFIEFGMVLKLFPAVAFVAFLHPITPSLLVRRNVRANVSLFADFRFVALLADIASKILDIMAILAATFVVGVIERTVDCFILVPSKLHGFFLFMQKFDHQLLLRVAE